MAVDDIIHLEVQGSLNAGLWQQSYFYKITADAADPLTNEVDVAKGWLSQVESEFLLAVSEELTIDCATTQRVFPVPVGNTFITPYPGNKGGLTGESLPATVAAIVTMLTAVTGRQTRGRKYFPGIRELDQQGGRIKATQIVLLTSVAEELTNAISEGDMTADPVIAHRDPMTPFNVLSSEVITQFTVRPRLGNQRRRKTFRTNVAAP